MSFISLLGVTSTPAIAPPPVSDPEITISETIMSFADTTVNQYSASQTYTVSGINLISDLSISAPVGFIVNTDNSNNNQSPINLAPVGGTVGATTIYVKFNPQAVQAYAGNVQNTSSGASPKNLTVDGDAAVPSITVSDTVFNFPDTEVDAYSVSQHYDVSGVNLYQNLIITAPSGFIINLDGSDVDASPISLVPVSGTVAATTIYIKFHPTVYQTYSGNITNASTGAATKQVAVDGDIQFLAETTAYMTAIAIPFNATVYFPGTPQQRTGNQLWQYLELHVRELKGIGTINNTVDFWSKYSVLRPYLGGTADRHKFNLKDPQDTDAAFRLTFFGGFTHNELGVQPNGTNGYAINHLNPSLVLPQNNTGAFCYVKTENTSIGGDYWQGLKTGTVRITIRKITSTGSIRGAVNILGETPSQAVGSFEPFNAVSRVLSTSQKRYYGKTAYTYAGSSLTPPNSSNYAELGTIYDETVPGPVGYSNSIISYTALGEGFANDTEEALMVDIIEDFQINLGREY